ncbi:hypothetical protein D3C73_819300 [compost metagenome]
MDADHSVMSQLGYGAAAVLAHVQQQPAHGIEEVAVCFNNLCFAADHEHQRTINRCRLAAGYRSIQEAAAAFLHGCCDFLHQSGRNGAGINNDSTRLQGAQNALRSVEYFTDGIVVADHGNNNVLVLCRSIWSSCRGCPCFYQRCAFLCRTVVYRNLEAFLEQVGRHRSAHSSESDKADLFHSISAFTL